MAQFREIREHPTTTERTELLYNVPDYLTTIIDKKVQNLALNCLEQFMDWLCTLLWGTYDKMYHLKIVMQRFGHDIAHPERVSIHTFKDGTAKLLDFTTHQGAGIRHSQELDVRTRRPQDGLDFITMRQEGSAESRRIFFSENIQIEITFSHAANTEYVVVENTQTAHRFRITEQEIGGPVKTWFVDTQNTRMLTNSLIPMLPAESILLATSDNDNVTRPLQEAQKDLLRREVLNFGVVLDHARILDLGDNYPLVDATGKIGLTGSEIHCNNRPIFIRGGAHLGPLSAPAKNTGASYILVRELPLQAGTLYEIIIGAQKHVIDPNQPITYPRDNGPPLVCYFTGADIKD